VQKLSHVPNPVDLQEDRISAPHGEDEPSSAGLAGPMLAGSVGEVEVEGREHPLPVQDEDVDRREG
jgi:hypothetical protein